MSSFESVDGRSGDRGTCLCARLQLAVVVDNLGTRSAFFLHVSHCPPGGVRVVEYSDTGLLWVTQKPLRGSSGLLLN